MNFEVLALLIEFFVQTVFLLLALWIMVKLQKLNYTFLGLLGSAALASGLDLIPYLGHPLAVGVLLLCIWKVTQSEYVDVAFTVFVGYALMFGMNLWLVGMLIGDLRPSAQVAQEYQDDPETALVVEARSAGPSEEESPSPTGLRHLAGPRANPLGATNQSRRTAAAIGTPSNANAAPDAAPLSKPAGAVINNLSVKGITRNGDKSSVAIFSGIKTYTLFVGDSVLMEIPKGTLAVRFDELGPDWIVLSVEGEPVKLALR